MKRILILFNILVVVFFNSQSEVVFEPDSVKNNQIYLVWNTNSSLRDSLQMEKVISYYRESKYIDECVEDGLVKHLLSVEKLPRFKKGNETPFMFLFNDPHFEPSKTRSVAAISFQGNELLVDLLNEMRYVTLDSKFTPIINTDFMPSFAGGYNAMMKYLNENVRHLENADEEGQYGAVILGFVIEKDGSIKDLKILENYNNVLDKEAYRLIQTMPKWQFGRSAGKPVSIFVALQLIFRL